MNTAVRRNSAEPWQPRIPARAGTAEPWEPRIPARAARTLLDDAVEELCRSTFASLRRKDQRRKGEQYVRGLLSTPGRKTIRNIAAHLEGTGTEQNLHHFISGSTWDCRPIRAALAQYLEEAHALSAWVVQPMTILKSGERSVGVGQRFDPHLNQTVRGQQSFGVWFTSPEVVTPVSWRLFLPDAGEAEAAQRCPTLPAPVWGEEYGESAATSVLEALRHRRIPRRPVILDVRDIAYRAMMNRFVEAGQSVLARVGANTPLIVADPAMPGYGAGPLPARQILESVKGLRHPVEWSDGIGPSAHRTSPSVAVRVTMADPHPARRRPLMLIGEWTEPRRGPSQLWVTDLCRTPTASLLRLSKQARRVSQAVAHSADDVGLRDFTGRSLYGWHRHMTMASVAHAAMSLAGMAYRTGPERRAAA